MEYNINIFLTFPPQYNFAIAAIFIDRSITASKIVLMNKYVSKVGEKSWMAK